MRLQASIEEALLAQASIALGGGSRFQFRVDEIGGDIHMNRFIVKLSSMVSGHVRADSFQGLATIYRDDDSDNMSVVVATIERKHRLTKAI